MSSSTADVADALIREATQDLHVGQALQVLTDDGAPAYLALLVREITLHRRP